MTHTYCYYLALQEREGVYSSTDRHVAMFHRLSDARPYANGRYYIVRVREDGKQLIYINQ